MLWIIKLVIFHCNNFSYRCRDDNIWKHDKWKYEIVNALLLFTLQWYIIIPKVKKTFDKILLLFRQKLH